MAEKSELPTKTSQLTNDSGFLTQIPSEYVTETELEYVDEKLDDIKIQAGSKTAYGTCSTAAETSEKAVVIDDLNWKLEVGNIITVRFSITNTASNVTLNVNNTGAYSIRASTSSPYTGTSTAYTGAANRAVTYMFDGSYWQWLSAGVYPSTATNVSLGQGYATCSTAASTTAKTASLSSYTLSKGGIVAVKFTYDVPAGATLNINSKGDKYIYHKGAAITDGVIKAGDTATFIYSTHYHLISIDSPSDAIMDELKIVTPQMFGAKADGVTDDSEAIKQAIATLPKDGGTLYFPPGIYIHGDGVTTGYSYQVDPTYEEGHAYYPAPLMENEGVDDKIGRDIKFDFDEYTNLSIKGYGAILQSHENNGECSNNRFFTFRNCENLLIEGITIDAKRYERGIKLSDYSPAGYDLARTNIQIDKCKKVIIRDVVSKCSQMDGLAIGHGSQTDFSEDILIENCKFLDNHRQGISIEGATNVTVRDTECSLNGTGDGIMPKSGIDIEAYGDVNEYEHYSFNYNILIDNCYFNGNGYQNIVVNNNSFNTVIQNCTFKNSWVNAQANNEAKLLNCHLENCRLSNGFSRIAYNTIIYNKGGFLLNSYDVSTTSASIIEHNTLDLTPTSETFETYDYNTIRLHGSETFRHNYVKNAGATPDSAQYPISLRCKEVVGNILELTNTSFDGIEIKPYIDIKSLSADGKYKDNRYIGYDIGAGSFNEYYRTDETMVKTYNSRLLSTSNVCSLLKYLGLMKITVRYLDQVEELMICQYSSYAHHYILRRNGNLEGKQLVTLYKDGSENYYLKYTWTNTSTTIECAYSYGDTLVDGLEYQDWLTVSDVSESSLTEIGHTDLSQFTSTLKTNYDEAYTHSTSAHAPSNAQKNSDITKAEIEAKLTGTISSHTHDDVGDYVQNNWGSENVGMILMVGSDGRVALYDLADYNPNAAWYNVTQNLINVSSDYNKTQAKENMPLTITLVTTNGKKMGTVTVIMNGDDVTSSVYSNSTITIESVMGDIIITAKAMLYTNLAEPNDDNTTDTEIWINGKRYSNYGDLHDNEGYVLTNYIPVEYGDVIRIKGFETNEAATNIHSSAWYSDKSHYFTHNLRDMQGNGFFNDLSADTTNNLVQFTSIVGTVAYFRFTGKPINGNENVIITVNEEIVE